MGEDDLGAVKGAAVSASLTASARTLLNLQGSGLTYSDQVAPFGGSTLSVHFGGAGHYGIAANLGGNTHYLVEAWLNFSSVETTQWILLHGFGGNPGGGILFDGGTKQLTLARSGFGITAFSGTITTGVWRHVAMVVNSSMVASFYFNGQLMDGTQTLASYAGNFSLGGDEAGNARFTGLFEQARFFTLDEGTFSTSMLSIVPDPATSANLMGLWGLAFCGLARRSRCTV